MVNVSIILQQMKKYKSDLFKNGHNIKQLYLF